MAQTVSWHLTSATQLTDYLSGTVAFAGGGSYILQGSDTRLLNFSNLPSSIAFGPGTSLTTSSYASSFTFQPSNGGQSVIAVYGLTINLYDFVNSHLFPFGAQNAVDYLFSSVVGPGSAYVGGSAGEVFQPFGDGDGLVGNGGNDLFQIGRISDVDDIAYIHGGATDGSLGSDTDTIEFTHAYTHAIDIVTNIDILKFSAAATPSFLVNGTTSALGSALSIVLNGQTTATMDLVWSGTDGATFETGNWTVSGGSGVVTLNLYGSDALADTITLQDNAGLTYKAYGQDGNDLLTGSSGNDLIDGGGDDDTLWGSAGSDVLEGWTGTNVLTYENVAGYAGLGVEITADNLGFGSAVKAIGPSTTATDTFGHFSLLRGTQVRDTFSGGSLNDHWEGLGGNDDFLAGAGDDTIDGGAGNDSLYGDAGADVLEGGDGSDTIDGAADGDIAIFDGDWADYAVTFDAGTSTYSFVKGADTDTVRNVEQIRFDSGDFAIEDLVNTGPVANDDVSGAPLIVEAGVSSAGNTTTSGNVLSNDTDANLATAGLDEALHVNGVRAGTSAAFSTVVETKARKGIYGTLTINADGSYSYVLDNADLDTQRLATGATGLDVFGYRIVDAHGAASIATLTVSVGGTNDRPVISSDGGATKAAIALDENIAAVTNVIVTDIDSSSRTFALSGVDADKFKISAGGRLSFISAPDAESPTDVGKNNTYNVRVTVDDGAGGTDFQDLAITVKNVLGNTISGTSGNDTIDKTHLIAGKGTTIEEDKIDGKAGDDTISAGSGNDTLIGGRGKDALTGGAGKDAFVFNAALSATTNVDKIRDFTHDVDVIQLDDAIFTTIGAKLNAGEFHAAAGAKTALDASDRVIYDTLTGKLYFDDDGTGAHLAIWFATLTTKPTILDYGDFAVV